MRVANPVDLIILNSKGQILLCKRTEEEYGYKGTWSIPGGGPEEDENFEDALHREIKEELGCTIKSMKYFGSYVMKLDEEFMARGVYFYGEIEGEINLNHELSEFRWYDMDDPGLMELDFAFNQKDVIKDFIRFWKERH